MTQTRKDGAAPRIVAECWTCKREPLIACRVNPMASDRFYRRPHFPHRPECYETEAAIRIKLNDSMARRHRAAGHDVREVQRPCDVIRCSQRATVAYRLPPRRDHARPHEEPMTVEEMLEDVQGYEPWYNTIDILVVAEIGKCEECGAGPLRFRGFKRGDSRRAFAVCPKGHALEF